MAMNAAASTSRELGRSRRCETVNRTSMPSNATSTPATATVVGLVLPVVPAVTIWTPTRTSTVVITTRSRPAVSERTAGLVPERTACTRIAEATVWPAQTQPVATSVM